MKTVFKLIIFVAVLAVLAAGGIKAVKTARAKEAQTPAVKTYPVVVRTLSPKPAHTQLTLPYLAEVHNDKDVEIAPRIAARIVSIRRSGSRVKKGDVVVRLDTTDIQSALANVNDQLKAAVVARNNLEATHKRTLELLDIQGASIEQSQKEATQLAELEAKIAGLNQKRIELDNALSYAVIVSPVTGTVAKTYAAKGATAMPGKPLIALHSDSGFYLMVRVPADLPIDGVRYAGKRYAATPLGSTWHGLAEYKVYPVQRGLTSGDRVEVSVIVFDGRATPLPFDAVLDRDGKASVLIVRDNHAVPRAVHVLRRGQEGLVVSDDLNGSRIVVAKPDILLRLLGGYALKVKE